MYDVEKVPAIENSQTFHAQRGTLFSRRHSSRITNYGGKRGLEAGSDDRRSNQNVAPANFSSATGERERGVVDTRGGAEHDADGRRWSSLESLLQSLSHGAGDEDGNSIVHGGQAWRGKKMQDDLDAVHDMRADDGQGNEVSQRMAWPEVCNCNKIALDKCLSSTLVFAESLSDTEDRNADESGSDGCGAVKQPVGGACGEVWLAMEAVDRAQLIRDRSHLLEDKRHLFSDRAKILAGQKSEEEHFEPDVPSSEQANVPSSEQA
jgi:hypothetical protein